MTERLRHRRQDISFSYVVGEADMTRKVNLVYGGNMVVQSFTIFWETSLQAGQDKRLKTSTASLCEA
jgi:hypothetical protein